MFKFVFFAGFEATLIYYLVGCYKVKELLAPGVEFFGTTDLDVEVLGKLKKYKFIFE